MYRLAIIYRMFQEKSALIQDKFHGLIYVDVIKFACCRISSFIEMTMLEICGIFAVLRTAPV